MRTATANEFIALDGVVQAAGAADETRQLTRRPAPRRRLGPVRARSPLSEPRADRRRRPRTLALTVALTMLAAACGDDGLGEESAAAVEHDARYGRQSTALGCTGGACETLPHKRVTSVDTAPTSLVFETHTGFDGKRHAGAMTLADNHGSRRNQSRS
jgi:hypothetical protein